MAIIGTACSSTSQASMPPGLLIVWIFMAFAGLLESGEECCGESG